MNVIFLSRLYKPHVGGVEKHVERISQILSKTHSITIIAEQHNSKLKQEEFSSEAKIFRIPINNSEETSKKWTIWRWVWKHRKLLQSADIIHIHDVFFWILPILPLLTRPKLFITFHGYEGSRSPGLKQIFWHKLAELFSWGNICIGNFHKKWYHIQPNIVSFGAVDPNKVSRKNVRQKKAIFIGRLDIDTGIMSYLDSLKEIKLPLDVYGDGPQLEPAKNFAKANSLNVTFYGFVPNASNFLSNYKVAFISRYLGILEALINKTPVIAHSDSDIKLDYLSDSPFSGSIFTASNSQGITKAYLEIDKKSHETMEMLKTGYNWANNQTWEHRAHEYERLWHQPSSSPS